MQIHLPVHRKVLLGLGCLSVCGLMIQTASAGDLSSTDHPANLARADFGTRLLMVDGQGKSVTAPQTATAALLGEHDPLGYALEAGATSMIVSLPKAEQIQLFNFLNLTAAGQVSVAVSNSKLPPNSPQWHSVVKTQEFSGQDVVNCELGSVEARYVKLDFQLTTAGRIDTFGLYGKRAAAKAGARRGTGPLYLSGNKFIGYDFVDYGGTSAPATVVHVSAGEDLNAAQAMVDGNLKTGYTFKPTDRHPMAVIDLGTSRSLRRVSVAYKAGPGRLDFYVMPDPTSREGYFRASNQQRSSADVASMVGNDFPGKREPIATVKTGDQTGLQRANVNVAGQSGRYLAVVYTSTGGGTGPTADNSKGGAPRTRSSDFKDFKDFKDTPAAASDNAPAGEPLDISEIVVFGPPPGTTVTNPLPPNTPPLFPPINPPPSSEVTP
jgi:hypothetical protein